MPHMVAYLAQLFPIFESFEPGRFLLKAMLFGLLYGVNSALPLRYLWSLALVAAMLVLDYGFTGAAADDGVAMAVRLYLTWMCAEVSFQSAQVEPEERLVGWWGLPLLFLIGL